MTRDEEFMALALKEARLSLETGDIPVGAIIVRSDEVLSRAHNEREKTKNALAHAELLAIERACERLGGWRLLGCEMFVTLEPCPMCAGGIINSRIERLVYGASDAKAGCAHSVISLFELPFNHAPRVKSGVLEEQCARLLSEFFKSLRA